MKMRKINRSRSRSPKYGELNNQVQTPYFTWAESYSNEGEQRIFLICIRFSSCEVRRLNLALRPWQTRTHCWRHIVADTHVSPFAHSNTNFVSGTQEMFLILFRNILCPQQMFPSLRSPRNIMGNNVSATMCLRLPGPLSARVLLFSCEHSVKIGRNLLLRRTLFRQQEAKEYRRFNFLP